MRWTSSRLWTVSALTAAALILAAGPASASARPASASARPGVAATANPRPLLAEDQFSAVACPAATGCLAVGQTTNGVLGAAAASWDGSSWHAQTPGVPSNAVPSSTDFLGESCPSAGRCVAVGKYALSPSGGNILTLAELWTGSGWQVLNTRYPSSDDHLGGVSCWAASDCIAVGGDRGFGGSHLPLAESWNGGPWVTMTTPSLGATDYNTMFNSVSCTSANWCMAVGMYDNTSHATFTLAEIWNGKQWTKVTTPGTGLSSVSCTSPSSCLAVSSGTVQQWNGTSWSVILTVPPPPGAPGFTDVTCLPASDCLLTGGNGTDALAVTWNGSSFHQEPVPSPAPGAQLTGAACTAADHCVGVGQSPGTGISIDAMAAYWGGKSWRVSRMGRVDGLGSVSCPQITRCLAVGSFLNRGDTQVPLAEREQKGTWQAVAPEPPGPGVSGLSSVSCASAVDCMAVNGAVGDRWNGKTWQRTSLPIGAGSVSCAAPACLAVGGLSAALWNGTSWTALSPVKPRHSNAAIFASVSCASSIWCMAVGQYFTDPHDSNGINLIEVWNGTAWRQLKLPGPGQNNGLSSVACTSAGHCMVVGSYNNSTDVFTSYAGLWNGTSWRTFTVAGPDRFLDSVSCPAATHCLAAGFYSTTIGFAVPTYRPIAESWSGGSWHKVPVHVGAGLFSSISCTQPDACVAVGQHDGGKVLTARWNGSKWSAMPAANP